MKDNPSLKLRSTAHALILLLSLMLFDSQSAAQTEQIPFEASFSQHADGSKWLQFPTYRGMHFAVERSTDLVTFEAVSGGLFYGDGNPREFYVLDPPPPPVIPDPNAPPAPPPTKPTIILHTLTICYASEIGNYQTVLKRPASGLVDSWAAPIPFTIPKGASPIAGLTIEDATAKYLLLITTVGMPMATLNAIPLTTTFTPEQQQERDLLFAHQAEILGALTQSHATVAQPPEPPSTPVPDARYFYRVTCRQIDTNGNGLYDWFESQRGYGAFLDGADPNAASQNTVDSITNLTLGEIQTLSTAPGIMASNSATGITPSPTDLDGDGVLDDLEAIANDPNFTYAKSLENSYIAIWLDQLTGSGSAKMPKNWDNSMPELVAMNDLGQLFFDYVPVGPSLNPPPDGTPAEHKLLVYDDGEFKAPMPSIVLDGKVAAIFPHSSRASNFAGGSLIFKVAGWEVAPNSFPHSAYASRYYIWKKSTDWAAPTAGSLVETGSAADEDPATITETGKHWFPVENYLQSYDNYGNALLRSSARSSALTEISGDRIEESWDYVGQSLGSLHGGSLGTGPTYPDSIFSTVNHDFEVPGITWETTAGDYADTSVSMPSSNGRVRVQHEWWHNIPDEEDFLSDHPTEYEDRRSIKWYQGVAEAPFQTQIFYHAPPEARSVNSWNRETTPAAGSGLPYRQGPLFKTTNGLATLTSDSAAGWQPLRDAHLQEVNLGNGLDKVTDRGEILLGTKLWRNNHDIDLALLADYGKPSNHPGIKIAGVERGFLSNQGMIAFASSSYYNGDYHHNTVLLRAAELAVDNNRDGTITLSSGADQTSVAKPYRFWLNNDHDNYGTADTYDAADDHPWTTKALDNANEKIEPERDLDDFARIHLNVGDLRTAFEAGTMTLGLKWGTIQSGTPKLRLFKAAEADGGTKYLSDTTKAADQVSVGNDAIGVVEGTTVLYLPVSFWTQTAAHPTKCFLFEGVTEGKGELTMIISQGGNVVGAGGSLFLDLLDVRKMYERWKVDGSAVIEDPDKDAVATVSGVSPIKDDFGYPYESAWDENMQDKQYAICVHGWRKGYYKARSDEITMFKRLWHRGFKGRYIGFQWPTYDVTVGDGNGFYDESQSAVQSKYNQSEFRAWKCGQALKTMVNGLPASYKRKIFAHSLGNVVVASALEKGMNVSHYAMLNAAIPAHCYDKTAARLPGASPDFTDDAHPTVRALSYRGDAPVLGRARLENVAPTPYAKITNFYLPADEALTGALSWESNQAGKPVGGYDYEVGTALEWDPVFGTKRLVTDLHEAMSMINSSSTQAAGANIVAGRITANVNLNGAGLAFLKAHEAPFKFRSSRTWVFYEKLCEALDLRVKAKP